jgi:hypothetical protein
LLTTNNSRHKIYGSFFLRSESARTVYRSKTNDVTGRKREEKKDRFCDGNSCHVCKN